MKYLSLFSFLSLATIAAGQTSAPIPAPTIAAGENPKVTPKPASQGGTLGPTSQVFVQEFGDTFAPAPTTTPEMTDPPSSGVTKPPVMMSLTGVAAAAALL